jgi:hypothetical protein
MVGFGWFVLALLFLDELLAMVATGIWGWHVGGPLLRLVVKVIADAPTMPPTR